MTHETAVDEIVVHDRAPHDNLPHDFDFLVGDWHIANRRLRKVLAGCEDWDEFPATSTCRLLLGGVGNVDEMFVPARGFNGMSIRTFDIERQEWSIFWVNDRNGRMDAPPVVGAFADGVGTFCCDDIIEGTPVRVRYTWSDMSANSARWEQAFSTDGGGTWETNWTMQLTR